ncbi:O-antigen ligase family protein [Halobacillus litoralis]|uniref:O-antigen ligase family protein n=1 Tax=Halobacillus litoralis TaxID=45668 RepID=UPI001CFE7088|nr:O-antigen ligase family protein [Halobacillus litoralis]
MDNKAKEKNVVSGTLLFFLFLLVTLGKYNVYLGFALKPYMIFCIVYLMFHLSSFRFWKFQIFEVCMFCFYFVYLYSGAFSLYAISSLRILLGVILYLSCYIVIKDIVAKAKHTMIKESLGYAGITFNLISLVLYVIGLKKNDFVMSGDGIISYGVMFDRDYPRLIGAVQDPNIFIFYNTIFFTYFLCHTKSWVNKIGLLLCITTTLLTFSRGGLLAMGLIFIVYFFMNRPLVQLKMVLGMIASFFILSYIMIVQLNFDFMGILESRIDDFGRDGGSGRFELWGRALDFFSSNTFYGIGAFNYRDYNNWFYGDDLYVHNTFLDILSESGLVGIIFFCTFMLVLIFQMFEVAIYRKEPFLYLTFIGFVLQMLSLSFVINDMFFLYLAILSAFLRIEQKQIDIKNLGKAHQSNPFYLNHPAIISQKKGRDSLL